jgi:hypothetical protein
MIWIMSKEKSSNSNQMTMLKLQGMSNIYKVRTKKISFLPPILHLCLKGLLAG